MKVGSKEFYEAQEMFEKVCKEEIYGHKLERDKSGIKGVWYKDGEVNQFFRFFLHGIEFEKCNNRLTGSI